MRITMLKTATAGIGLAAIQLVTAAAAAGPDNMVVVLDKVSTTGASNITLGGFVYDPIRHGFWVGTFGTTTGFRFYDIAAAAGQQYVFDSDLQRFAIASDVPEGITNADDGGKQNPSGLLLNPTELTIEMEGPGDTTQTVVYPPGTLVISNDNSSDVKAGGTVTRYDWTKKMYRWDLRAIGAATDLQPDYANAQDGRGNITGALGIVDWNDTFSTLVTAQNLYDIAGVASGTLNQGRQPTWSSDGKHVYFIDSASTIGGLWKVNVETAATSWIYQNTLNTTGARRINTEPAVISTAVRDFDPANEDTGDQIFFAGSTLSGNEGGLDYLLDTGTTISGPFAALRTSDFNKWAECGGKYSPRIQTIDGLDPGVNHIPDAVPNIATIAAGNDGTLYFNDTGSFGVLWKLPQTEASVSYAAVWRYDPQGQLSVIRSQVQHRKFNAANGLSSTTTQVLRAQVREVSFDGSSGAFTIPQVLFRDNATGGISGINVFTPGDFNRDGTVDAADVALLDAALAVPIQTFTAGTAPIQFYEAPVNGEGVELETADPDAYLEYLKFDLNGSGLVTMKDRQIMARFLGKCIVDYDWDGDVDQVDYGHFQECYTGANGLPATVQLTCGDAELTGDGRVNNDDLAVFQGCISGPAIAADPLCGT